MARAIVVASGTTDVQGITGAVTLVGYSARETATEAAAASAVLRDGTSTSGVIKAEIGLPASGSLTATVPAVEFTTGIFVDRTGSSEIVLYIL